MQNKEKQLALSNEILGYSELLKEATEEEQEISDVYCPLIVLTLTKLIHLQKGQDGVDALKKLLDKI